MLHSLTLQTGIVGTVRCQSGSYCAASTAVLTSCRPVDRLAAKKLLSPAAPLYSTSNLNAHLRTTTERGDLHLHSRIPHEVSHSLRLRAPWRASAPSQLTTRRWNQLRHKPHER